jgi:hypothetical protein
MAVDSGKGTNGPMACLEDSEPYEGRLATMGGDRLVCVGTGIEPGMAMGALVAGARK